ncbi:MAG: hypothetical protein J6V71_03650 [Clostridia bacterium]|nr:hypothetical protein [Clostridia bacterium]
MFDNIGEKIKGLARISTIIGFVLSFVGAVYCWVFNLVFLGFVVLIVGCLLSWIGSFFMYGFGELITQTTNVAKGTKRLQMLAIYKDSTKSTEITKETIDDIKEEIVEDYEKDKYDYADELDKINTPKSDECPSCFNKIDVNDKECSYCGYKLK